MARNGKPLKNAPEEGAPEIALENQIDRAMRMLRQGVPVTAVARRFNKTDRTIRRWREDRRPGGASASSGRASVEEVGGVTAAGSRTDTEDGQGRTDTVDAGPSDDHGGVGEFAKDPQVRRRLREAARERAEQERLEAVLSRMVAQAALREAEERNTLRLQKIRETEQDRHCATTEALRVAAEYGFKDRLLMVQLAGWHWQGSGGAEGQPYKGNELLSKEWSKGFKAAEASDPTKLGGSA